MDWTNDPGRRSWLASACHDSCDFPLQNLPLGVFRPAPAAEPRVGIAIGDQILDVRGAHSRGLFEPGAGDAADACTTGTLNPLMAAGPAAARSLRERAGRLLGPEATPAEREAVRGVLVPQRDAAMGLPATIGDFTDFYASIHHATNVGRMMRPDNPLLPNYTWVPIGYHGRASSIVVSGTPVRRPRGQLKPDAAAAPVFAPSRRLDYELELGVYVGPGNALGETIPIDEVGRHLFGCCLVNDWSARDVQTWEYQPLGPFLAKNFATTVSPWVVTFDALAPFRAPVAERPPGDPEPLPYLHAEEERRQGAFDLTLEVWLSSAAMRERDVPELMVSRSNLRDLYWTIGQLVTHHASGGCNLRPGDLLATGTVSGPTPEGRACLLERTWRGTEPLRLPTGEERRFLEDGDEVVLRARAARRGAATIGFGECRGRIVPG